MKLKDAEVLVTGGAGFLGSHLIDTLVENGANVTVVESPEANITNIIHHENKMKVIRCDISNSEDMKKLPETTDIIFHLAAIADPRICEEKHELAFKVNVQGTFNTLNY